MAVNDPFVQQLCQLCQQRPTGAKWVFVPHQGLRWTLAERLLQAGQDWVNLRMVTPFQMALDAVAPQLLERGCNPCPETLGPSLLQTLLLSRAPQPGYFRGVLSFPGTAEALWTALQQFRMAGLRARDLQRLPNSPKLAELRSLFQAYEDYLQEENLADRALLFQTPPERLPILADDLVVIYPYHRWSALEWHWLQALPGRAQPAWAPPAPNLPRGWTERQEVSCFPVPPRFFAAPRRFEEVEVVVQQLLEKPQALDSVEIAALDEELAFLRDRLEAAGLACTFESGLAALQTRPGQALQGLLRWLEADTPAGPLCDMLGAGLLEAQPSAFRACQLLQSAQITWGRQTYFHQLSLLPAHQAPPEEVEQLQDWLRQLFQRFPLSPGSEDRVSLRDWLTGLQLTLRQDVPVTGAEVTVQKALVADLEELKTLPQADWSRPRLLILLQQRLKSLRVLTSRPRPGHLHVCHPRSLGLAGRQVHYWIGLEEGQLTLTPTPDCVLSDAERSALSEWLPRSGQPQMDLQQHLADRLQTLTGELTLSCALHDLEGQQEQLPAWQLFQQVRRVHPEVASYPDLKPWLGVPRRPALPPRVEQAALHEVYPWLKRAHQAQVQRQSDRLTPYDGWVAEAAGRWNPSSPQQVFSASALQALATCPFQFFLERGLGLRRPPAQQGAGDGWLDPATRGTLLHDVYAAYYRALRSRGLSPHPERDRSLLQDLLQAQLEQVRSVLPPPSEAWERAERDSLWRELEHFLQLELQSPQRQPVAFEVPFGMGPDDEEILAREAPVTLVFPQGLTLTLRGRIDRMDRLGSGYAVVDYKTGRKLYTASSRPWLDRGRLLQHALYTLVAQQLLQQPVIQASYYFPTRGAERPWLHFPAPDPGALEEVLSLVLQPLSSGAFVHTHEPEKDCRFCPYQTACEAQDSDHNRRKLDNPDNLQLEARRQLLRVE